MKNFFNENNVIISALSHLGDLIILNALFILFSLPVITIGCSMTAAFRVAIKLADKSCGHVTKEFFSGFKANFRQATPVWCVSMLVFALLWLYYAMAAGSEGGVMRLWLLGAAVIAIFTLAVLCYLFPLISRYENSLSRHIKNAAILAVCNLPRTLVMMVLCLFPVVLFLMYTGIFFYLFPFWLLFGFAAIISLNAAIMLPVMKKIEETKE